METATSDRLSRLPPEILFRILSLIPLEAGGGCLVRASKALYTLLIRELYRQSATTWAPLFIGALSGDIRILKRCFEAGAPLDYRWPGYDPKWWVLNIDEGDQPLHTAMMHYQVEAVEWILSQGVNPYEKGKDGDIPTLSLVIGGLLEGFYPRKLEVPAGWRQERVQIPSTDALARRGHKIVDLLGRADASHDPRLIDDFEREYGPVKAETVVEDKGHSYDSFLLRLPLEMLIEVLSHLSPADGGFKFVSASRIFYHALILPLYREAGRKLSWLPLFVGVVNGRLRTLEMCRKVGAPMDHRWQGNHLTTKWPFLDGIRPLHLAVELVRPYCVRWLLGNGASPINSKQQTRVLWQPSPLALAGWCVIEPPRLNNEAILKWIREGRKVAYRFKQKELCQEVFNTLVQASGIDFTEESGYWVVEDWHYQRRHKRGKLWSYSDD